MPEQETKQQEQPVILEEVWEVAISPVWTGALVKALAAAQLKFKPVVKQTDNAAFMRGGKASKYADLAEYIDATQQALAENGLVVTQWPDVSPSAKSMSLVSFLMHTSGEWMRGRLTLPATGRDGFTPQSCGSSITYARRYSYAAITGCASEDDDGNAASGRGTADAAKDVAKRKIAEAAQSDDPKVREIAERAQKQEQPKPPECLFYVWPPDHHGNFAEFVNVREFGSALDQVAQEGLRSIFQKYGSKVTKSQTVLVSSSKLDALLEVLVGDIGCQVKLLAAPNANA
jgi:ERF superfamily